MFYMTLRRALPQAGGEETLGRASMLCSSAVCQC